MNSVRTLEAFASLVRTDGVAAGLAFLNAGVPHRFSAVYRVDGDLLENVFLQDKAGEVRPDYLAVVPLGQSFCQFVLRDGVFRTDDSAADERLDGHPYQGVMLSYHSVPIGDGTELWGRCAISTSSLGNSRTASPSCWKAPPICSPHS